MRWSREVRAGHKRYAYLYSHGTGHAPRTCGRVDKCPSRRVRADRLDTVVWDALCHLLRTPTLIPALHQTWGQAKQQHISALAAQQAPRLQRRQRLERQSQRFLDASQAESISLDALQSRRKTMTAELHQIAQELQQLMQTQQQTMHWQQGMDQADTFRQLLGEQLDQLAFEERQAVVQCLISKVIITGEEVDISYVLPFGEAPQGSPSATHSPEGAPGQFYRLRLADRVAVEGMEILRESARL
jgi:hypothetical protein